MNFPLPGTSSRPQSLQQYQHHHHHISRSRQSFQIPSRQLNPNNSYTPLNITRINNPQFPNDFNFPLRSTRISSARSPSSPSRKVSRFAAIKEEIGPEIMNQAMHRPQSSQESSGGMPQYRIFKRGETIPGFSSPLSLIPQGTSSQPHVDLSSIIRSSSEQENQAPGVKEDSELPSNENNGGTGGRRAPGNRTPISLVSDIARFHNVQAEYRLTGETGPPHAPTFTVILNLGEEQYQAQGPSIKKAQLSAATTALEKTSLKSPPPRNQPKKQFQSANNNNNNKNPKRANWTIMRLNALADELGEKISFTSQPVQILNPFNRADPPAIVAVNIGDRVFTAEGPNVTAAKNSAALAALKVLTQQKKERELAKTLENEVSLLAEAETLDSDIKSPISIVHEMALKRGLKVTFEIVSEEGPPHMKVFTLNCKVGALETEGQGPTKQQAKKATCEAMITKLKEIPLKQPNLASLKSLQNGLKAKPKAARKKPSTPVIKEVKTQVVSPISRLLQIAHVRKYKEPEFRVVGQTDGADAAAAAAATGNEKSQDRRSKRKKPFFTMEVLVGPYICQGSGSNKKSAKKAAADAALVQMGYAPTEVIKEEAENSEKDPPDGEDESPKKSGDLKITGARQIVPGVLILHSEHSGNSGGSSTVGAQEIAKVNSMSVAAEATPTKVLDGIGKLAYLAELLGISVSYSDFPKKNEFLSVASLGTNPPHVAHGIGPTREEAQNSAAVQILEELSTTGLDNLTSSTPRSS